MVEKLVELMAVSLVERMVAAKGKLSVVLKALLRVEWRDWRTAVLWVVW